MLGLVLTLYYHYYWNHIQWIFFYPYLKIYTTYGPPTTIICSL